MLTGGLGAAEGGVGWLWGSCPKTERRAIEFSVESGRTKQPFLKKIPKLKEVGVGLLQGPHHT